MFVMLKLKNFEKKNLVGFNDIIFISIIYLKTLIHLKVTEIILAYKIPLSPSITLTAIQNVETIPEQYKYAGCVEIIGSLYKL